MSEKIRLFTKIFLAELEDLEEDLESWGTFMAERHASEKISEYVYKENTSLLKQEINAVHRLVSDIQKRPLPEGQDLAAYKASLESYIADEVKNFQFPQAILDFARRKLQKVYQYVM